MSEHLRAAPRALEAGPHGRQPQAATGQPSHPADAKTRRMQNRIRQRHQTAPRQHLP